MTRCSAVALLLAMGCAAAPPAPGLRVETDLVPQTVLLEGEIATIKIRIQNRSADYVLLRSLEDPEMGIAMNFQAARRGGLKWDRETDVYTHDEKWIDPDTLHYGTTAEVFNSGLIVPSLTEGGETFHDEQEFSIRFRLIDLPRQFRLRYWVLPRSLVLDRVYFPVNAPPTKSPDERDRVLRYQRPTPGYLDRYSRERLRGDFAAALRKDRFVFFPDDGMVSLEWTLGVRVNAQIPRRPFSKEDALRVAGIASPGRVTYCSRLEAWILFGQDGSCHLVRQEGAIRIPPADPEIFFALDARERSSVVPDGHAEFQFLDETQLLFDEWYGHRGGDPVRDVRKTQIGVIFSSTRGENRYAQYLVLPDARVIEFLERAGADGRLVLKRGPAGAIRVAFR
jgi:hypothetical protein